MRDSLRVTHDKTRNTIYIKPKKAAQKIAAFFSVLFFSLLSLVFKRKLSTFAPRFTKNARMAELVDAPVSNTGGRKAVPVRPRLRVLNRGKR